jgi:FAD/FMN-containing dehydrogenase
MDIPRLRSDISGSVFSPDDNGFAESLFVYAVPGPALIVRANTEADVVAAVRFAAAEGLGVAVRSGGHAGPMFSPAPDRVLIDLHALSSIAVGDDGIVEVGPGASWGDVAAEVQKHGLAITSGDTASVGVGGLALGGGIGWLVRRDGLALDGIVEARVVLASGELVTASAVQNTELLWALRGGGGNFGVVTAFRFRAHPLGAVLAVTLNATFAVIPNGPPGPDFAFVHHIVAVWAGEESEESRAAVAPLLAIPGVVDSDVMSSDYRSMLAETPGGPDAPPPNVVVRDALLATFDDAAIDAVLAARGQLGPSVLTVRFLGGAFGRVPADATAFAHRSADAIVNIVEFLPPGAPAAAARVDAAWASVAQRSIGTYGNFTTAVGPEVVSAMYPPATLARLRAAKAVYDPHNRFADNQNITPS